MSTIIKFAGTAFRRGAGHNVEPLVAKADLLMGYDMRDYAIWKTGLVAGQTAKAYTMQGSKVLSDAGISRSSDGLGVTVDGGSQVDFSYSMPCWSNAVEGRTIMVVSGFRPNMGQSKYGRALVVGSNLAVQVNELTNTTFVGSVIDQANTQNQKELAVAMSQMIVCRSNGDGTWTTDIPDTRFKITNTDTELNVVNPLVLWSGTLPGPVLCGTNAVMADNTSAYWVTRTLYQAAIWNRKLTDAEVAEQYQRSRLRFPGVLM
jgi:hypothetical protein